MEEMEELERLLAEFERMEVAFSDAFETPYERAQYALDRAVSNALPRLLAAARREAALREEADRTRSVASAAIDEAVRVTAERDRLAARCEAQEGLIAASDRIGRVLSSGPITDSQEYGEACRDLRDARARLAALDQEGE